MLDGAPGRMRCTRTSGQDARRWRGSGGVFCAQGPAGVSRRLIRSHGNELDRDRYESVDAPEPWLSRPAAGLVLSG